MTKEELYKEYPTSVKIILKCIKDFRMKTGTLEFSKDVHYYGIITNGTYYLIDNSKDKHGMSVTRNVDIFTPVNTSDINTVEQVRVQCVEDFIGYGNQRRFTKGKYYTGTYHSSKNHYILINDGDSNHTMNSSLFKYFNRVPITLAKPTSTLSDKITINSVTIPKL